MTTDLTGILRRTDLLCSASTEDVDAAAAASQLRTIRRGQIVFTAGDPGDTVIVVVSGRVKVVVRSADGGELTLAIVQPGGFFGEIGIVDSGPRSADAQAIEECRLIFIPRQVVREICARVPSVAEALSRSIAASLRRLTDAVSDLVFLDLPRRVAKVVLSQPVGEDGTLLHKMSQKELAHQAGSTRQSVNTALKSFERRGWIEVHDRVITVKQAAALRRFAGQY